MLQHGKPVGLGVKISRTPGAGWGAYPLVRSGGKQLSRCLRVAGILLAPVCHGSCRHMHAPAASALESNHQVAADLLPGYLPPCACLLGFSLPAFCD